MKIINKIFLVICLLLCIDGFCALKFDKEADKGEWIKNTFLGKGVYEFSKYQDEKLMNDFINQKNIEYIEAMGEGVDINDPNIAKYGDITRYMGLEYLFNGEYLFSGLFKHYNEVYLYSIYRDLESNKGYIISIWNKEMSTTSVIY